MRWSADGSRSRRGGGGGRGARSFIVRARPDALIGLRRREVVGLGYAARLVLVELPDRALGILRVVGELDTVLLPDRVEDGRDDVAVGAPDDDAPTRLPEQRQNGIDGRPFRQ